MSQNKQIELIDSDSNFSGSAILDRSAQQTQAKLLSQILLLITKVSFYQMEG